MNKNPIQPIEPFHTPKDMAGLQHYVSLFTGAEGAVANTVLGMTWNLAAKVVDQALAAEAAQETEGEQFGRDDCPVIEAPCEHYSYQTNSDGSIVVQVCCHPDNLRSQETDSVTHNLCPKV